MTALPIDDALPDILEALRTKRRAVLQAPPGAGKTTRVPLALLDADICDGRILMLEPRRLATRAAAERMAETLGEAAGDTVGYRMRGATKTSKNTKIEVVTEGILTRMIQSDPELTGIGAIIFDEFHERSLNADLGLALTWEIRGALRQDLVILVMSATLDAAPVAKLLANAPLITSSGRAFPVVVHHLDRPRNKSQSIEDAVAALTLDALEQTNGAVLVFLPGEGEIRRVQARLAPALPSGCVLRALFGSMPFADQRRAIQPDLKQRKIVLATSIAETSLTIEDVRVVIDAGLARRARFDAGSGMSRLVTEKVSRAEATQRTGRAGRVAEGTCFRLWTKGEEGALPAFPPAEIEAADLTGLALELAVWGTSDLGFLTPPPEGALQEARNLLTSLGALDRSGTVTSHGRKLANLPVHPRLGHMLEKAGAQAAPLAAILSERDPIRDGGSDLGLRLRAISGQYSGPGALNPAALVQLKNEAKRLAKGLPECAPLSIGEMAALAYPDRVGMRRKGEQPRYLLSGGKGAVLDASDALANARFIVATALDGNPREAKIRQAAILDESELRALFHDQIEWLDICRWSRRDRKVLTRRQEVFGALVLDDRNWADAPETTTAQAMCDGVREIGLRLTGAAASFRARVELLRAGGVNMPAMDDESLSATLETWLAPHLGACRSAEAWKRFDPLNALRAMLDWGQMQTLDSAAPSHFVTPLGRRIPIDYDSDPPEITLRLQEMFGTTVHPKVGLTALKVTLLSPGGKPIQVTSDIPGFWSNSYADVRKDMRGRYPKHPWPEDPTKADPTLRAKPRA